MSLQRSGRNPLAYLGVEPSTPPNLVIEFRSPATYDTNFNIGDIWLRCSLTADNVLDTVTEVWILTILNDGIATWTQIYPISASGASIFPCDVGTAVEVGNIINMFGANNISTSGAGNTVTITLSGAIADQYVTDSGTAIPSGNVLNVLGINVVNTSGSSNIVTITINNGTDGQLLIGGGAQPLWANVTSVGGTISIGNGPNSLNLEVGGAGIASQYQTDSGTAVPAAGVINYLGDININTTGAGNTLTVDLDNNVLIAGSLTTGTTVTAGTGLTVNSGGITSTGTTRLRSLTAGVMQTNGSGVVSSTNGTNGQLLIGGGTAPAWNNITSTGGTVTITNGANTINLEQAGGGGGIGTGPAFLAYQLNQITSGTQTGLLLGTKGAPAGQPAIFETYDQGNNFTQGNVAPGATPCVFTAPTTGRYYLDFYVQWSGLNGRLISTIRIITTARTYESFRIFTSIGNPINFDHQLTVIADMTAGDTATYFLQGTQPAFPFVDPVVSAYASGPNYNTIKTRVSGFKIS